MPEYIYKAVTNKGQIVKNKVDGVSKQELIAKLKNNGLVPIDIKRTAVRTKKVKKAKRNVNNIQDIMKTVNTSSILNKSSKQKISVKDVINTQVVGGQKVTSRDLVIFTQNFYLLKKANFNNIHALATIIEGTENLTLKGILEDILAGVEGRRIYVYNYGILFKCISIYLYKYD